MSHNIETSLCHEWSSTGPHCVNVVTVTLKYFKMRMRIHSTDAMDDKSSPSICTYCKCRKPGNEARSYILCFHPQLLSLHFAILLSHTFLTLVTTCCIP